MKILHLAGALPLLAAVGMGCTQPSPDSSAPTAEARAYAFRVHQTGTAPSASFRGLSVASNGTFWASGSEGHVLRSTDSGRNWEQIPLPDQASNLDFRDNHALSTNHIVLMAAGPGEASAIYESHDGGQNWTLQLANPDPEGFFDSIALRADGSGVLLGDPVGGRFTLFQRDPSGTWTRLPSSLQPSALAEEHCFAASGTVAAVASNGRVRIATGGKIARLLSRSELDSDPAKSIHEGGWSSQSLPIRSGQASQGIFSVAFRDSNHGIAIGGDYSDPENPSEIAARTTDGGKTWTPIHEHGPSGYRSCVAPVPGSHPPVWVAVGSHGADWSQDDGKTWQSIPDLLGYHVVAFDSQGNGVAIGAPQQPFVRLEIYQR